MTCRHAGAPVREETGGYVIRRIPSTYLAETRLGLPYPLPAPRAFAHALRTEIARADVVHVQDAVYATSVAALVDARRRGVPAVLTQHVGFVPQRSRSLDLVQLAAHATLGRCARLAAVVATYNTTVAHWAGERWGLRDVRMLPVGVPRPDPRPAGRSETRRSLGLPLDRPIALFVGRDVPKKGLDVFLGAADPAYELVAVTDRAAAANGVRVLPFMASERLLALFSAVDAFVLPSEAEGFPLSLQEALAAGLPIVTTRQDGYEHYLQPDDVLYVERNATAVRRALLRLVSEQALREELGARARGVAERHFGVEAFVGAYEALYREVLRCEGPR